jgi:hypothetical protein
MPFLISPSCKSSRGERSIGRKLMKNLVQFETFNKNIWKLQTAASVRLFYFVALGTMCM